MRQRNFCLKCTYWVLLVPLQHQHLHDQQTFTVNKERNDKFRCLILKSYFLKMLSGSAGQLWKIFLLEYWCFSLTSTALTISTNTIHHSQKLSSKIAYVPNVKVKSLLPSDGSNLERYYFKVFRWTLSHI